ncbi:hypothetical protein DC3_30190 [Deinococcus cellulosilyticus NBRC 106333 = KACC 11606]|uniref:Uncharacterized protein n=1 Tax=Deinococcus cellulosilyticus (strain DSM 18568 / NBRC 106333 / KACC 11606 / 5516J-15) TaxID=1223518 RepID=A0A511N3E1_DEIC1|nr:hypothetical protein DC3_30190 [Deinococcus cellulosilyticus NBRC 106333 = KACC 11606]
MSATSRGVPLGIFSWTLNWSSFFQKQTPQTLRLGIMEDIATWMWVLGAIVTIIIMAAIVSRTRPPKRPDPPNQSQSQDR